MKTSPRALVWLGLLCPIACGGGGGLTSRSDGGPDAPADGAFEAHGAVDGAAGDAPDGAAHALGDAAGPEAGPTPIPPPPDLCGAFQLRYAPGSIPGLTCDTCAPVECGCAASGLICSPRHGCLQSEDCTTACAAPTAFTQCVLEPCTTDADCAAYGGHACVTLTPGATEGVCDPGVCADDGDCAAGQHCVAVEDDGTRRCIDPSTNHAGPCDRDADCPSGRCTILKPNFHGYCTTGGVDEDCFGDADCASGLRCQGRHGAVPGFCSSGGNGPNGCNVDGDCQLGRCVSGACSSGEVGENCDKAADCQSGFCAFGTTCSDGALDAPCAKDDECLSGRCAASVALSACTSGAPGSKCLAAQNCLSGVCRAPTGIDLDPSDHRFGTCE